MWRLDDASKAQETPLLGGGRPSRPSSQGSSVWSSLVEDVEWARDEMQDMLMLCCPASVAALPPDEQRQCACVRYNPIYWVVLALCVVAALTGRWVHVPFGQGGPVRGDETRAERDARVQWVYTTDGPFAMAAVGGGLYIALAYASGSPPDDEDLAETVADVLIDIFYVLGNVYFLDAMRRRAALRVRVGIVANGTFAAGLVLLLLYGVLRVGFSEKKSVPPTKQFTWCVRAFSVLFFVLAVVSYAALWEAYDDHGAIASTTTPQVTDDATEHVVNVVDGGPRSYSDSTCPEPVQYLVIVLAALVVWTLLIVLVFLGGPLVVWSAVG